MSFIYPIKDFIQNYDTYTRELVDTKKTMDFTPYVPHGHRRLYAGLSKSDKPYDAYIKVMAMITKEHKRADAINKSNRSGRGIYE